jgi:hypothetical protein
VLKIWLWRLTTEQRIVLENLDEISATWIEKEAERRETTREQVVLDLVRAGILRSQLEVEHEPDDLAGTWSDEEAQEIARQAVEALLSTGRARRLPALPNDDKPPSPRRAPLKLPGMPVSEILIAQRRGEL